MLPSDLLPRRDEGALEAVSSDACALPRALSIFVILADPQICLFVYLFIVGYAAALCCHLL